MAEETLTEQQREAIFHGKGTMLVAAGAGSGKTFMLTQRIGYLFSKESGEAFGHANYPAISDIDKICAITFTEAAAQELKDRIRAKLEENEATRAQALRVDSAWISTIHGMCSRILKSYAVDLDIDPNFGVIADVQQQTLMQQAFEEAISATDADGSELEDGEYINPKYAALIDEYNLSGSRYSSGVREMVFELMSQASMSINGFKDIQKFDPPVDFNMGCGRLCECYEKTLQVLQSANDTKTKAENIAGIQRSIDAIRKSLSDEKYSTLQYHAKLLNECYRPKKVGNAEIKAQIQECQQMLADCCSFLGDVCAARHWPALRELAIKTAKIYTILKRENAVLDNNDLLRLALHALDTCEPVRADFANKFKLVMVDEFQDTSSLQIAVIQHVLGKNTSLNVVGDAQQSIYRFQGADVSVFNSFKDTMKNLEASENEMCKQMSTNFRSADNVLSFVEKIFSDRRMFGTDFLALECGKEKLRPKTKDSGIHFIAVGAQGKGMTQAVVQKKAELIADKFKELKNAGYAAKDMVLLLGKMNNANIFGDALRSRGFNCVVASGSNLNETLEVKNVVAALSYFKNPEDEMALFNVLAGPMFNISVDEISAIFKGAQITEAAKTAVNLINEAASVARHDSIASAVKHIFAYSGWASRLEHGGPQEYAQAANVLKAIHAIHDIEKEMCDGFITTCEHVIDAFGGYSKLKPGALTIEDTNAIKIMTIHGSKGLQFPVVAVADFVNTNKPGMLRMERFDQTVVGYLAPSSTFNHKYPNVKKYAKDAKEDSQVSSVTVEEVLKSKRILCDENDCREQDEDKRKLYVGLTRAEEVLILASDYSVTSKNETKFGSPVNKDLFESLFGPDCEYSTFPSASFDFGGTAPATFTNCQLTGEEPEPVKLIAEDSFHTIDAEPFVDLEATPEINKLEDLVSYSSLRDDVKTPYEVAGVVDDPEEQVYQPAVKDKDHATDLGSAFHLVAQYGVETQNVPSRNYVSLVAHNFGLTDDLTARLYAAVDSWYASDVFKQTLQYDNCRAELEFCVPYDEEKFLQGAMDLVCFNGPAIAKSDVVIYDYKTGGSAAETKEALLKKHAMQAQCYAEAARYAGAKSVKVVFVRVEQNCQSVTYSF